MILRVCDIWLGCVRYPIVPIWKLFNKTIIKIFPYCPSSRLCIKHFSDTTCKFKKHYEKPGDLYIFSLIRMAEIRYSHARQSINVINIYDD